MAPRLNDRVHIGIGGTSFSVASRDGAFLDMIRSHYGGFIEGPAGGAIDLAVDVTPPRETGGDEDLSVRSEAGEWILERGDFHATYNPGRRRGTVRQDANRFSLDSVFRIVQSLELAAGSGLLLHAASAIRGERAFLFAGPSGAGKTTISRLAPADVCLLTDEISCVRRSGAHFEAWGTPFSGELARPGENRRARIGALYFLEQARENRIEALGAAEALRLLLKNVLFFAHDTALVRRIFDIAHEFVSATPVFRLSFQPVASVWNLIGEADA